MRAALADAVRRSDGRPVLVGFSGGLDSTVLLHLLAADPGIRTAGLRAIHVHHGLHVDADAWAMHCERACGSLGVPLVAVHVQVPRDTGLGLEASAREARHRAFADALRDDEILALAHHRDDQAETFLLRALRGSGIEGLGAMRSWRRHRAGWLWRPLLDVPRQALREWAIGNALDWIEDPGNADPRFDRNFLRTRVMPLLLERWPQASANFARSASLSAEATGLLADEDAAALASAQRNGTLAVDALLALPRSRRARLLRRWVESRGLPPLPGNGVERIERELLVARKDGGTRFDWQGASILRWRDRLHAGTMPSPLPPDWSRAWDGAAPLALPGGGTLELVGAAAFDAPLRAHARLGGERILLPGRTHHHALKHVLQDADVPPWVRTRMPLLSDADGELLAAGDAIVSARLETWLRERGARLRLRAADPAGHDAGVS